VPAPLPVVRSVNCHTSRVPISRASQSRDSGELWRWKIPAAKLSAIASNNAGLPVAAQKSRALCVVTATCPPAERARCISASARSPAPVESTPPNSSIRAVHCVPSGSANAAAAASAKNRVVIARASSGRSSTHVRTSTTAPARIAAGKVTAPRAGSGARTVRHVSPAITRSRRIPPVRSLRPSDVAIVARCSRNRAVISALSPWRARTSW